MSGLELRTLAGMLVRQWRLIASITALTLLLTTALLSQLSYRYTAEALLTIDERESQLVGQEDPTSSVGVTLNNRVDTEVEIMASSSVALGVIDRLALWRDPEFGFTALSLSQKLGGLVGIKSSVNDGTDIYRLDQLPSEVQAQLVKKLSSAVRISRRGLTSVIAVEATSKDREKSAKIANAVTESYLDVQINAKARTAQRAVDFLSQRVDELARGLQDTESKTENFILTQADKVGTPEARAQMATIRDQITNIAGAQAEFNSRINALRSLRDNPAALSPENVPAELRALAEERAALSKKALANAAAPDLQAQLKVLDQKLSDMADLKTNDLQNQLAQQDKSKDDLRKQLQEVFTQQKIPSEVSVNLYRLQREAETSRKLYETFSTRLGEVQQRVGLAMPNSRIVAPAIVPAQSSFPPSTLMLVGGTLLGLALGFAAAFAREQLVGGFASSAQVEDVTGLPVLASIPRDDNKMPHNMIIESPLSSFAESLRRLRLGVEENSGDNPSRVVLVTSTEPGEGKSTLSLSLGRALALAGRKTLLVDCDFRHPSIGRLGEQVSSGDLSDILSRAVRSNFNVSQAALMEEATSLYVLTTTSSKKQASDVIVSSPVFSDFLAQCQDEFEFIILDSPPIGYVVDARILATYADLLIYVIKQNSTSQQDAVSGLRQLIGNSRAVNMGVVLNSMQNVIGGYYYGNSRYSYYYKDK